MSLLLGRENEEQLLMGALARASDAEDIQVLRVHGELGVGARSLTAATVGICAESGWSVLRMSPSRTDRFCPYLTLARGIRDRAKIHTQTPLLVARTSIEKMIASDGVPSDHVALTRDVLGEIVSVEFRESEPLKSARRDQRIMRDLVRIAVGNLLSAIARTAPLIVYIERAELADIASLDLLASVLPGLSRLPVVVLHSGTMRLVPPTFELEVKPLDRAHIETLVSVTRGRPEPSIVHKAQGNPLFAHELSLWARAGGDPDALPIDLARTSEARIRTLDPEVRSALAAGAVLGGEFTLDDLSDLEIDRPLRSLSHIEEEGIVERDAEERFWRFRHPAVAAACYEAAGARVRTLHDREAARLVRRKVFPGLVARHFDLSGHRRRSLDYTLRALIQADHLGARHRVVELASALLNQATTDRAGHRDMTELHARVRRADALFALGRFDDAGADLDSIDALDLMQSRRDSDDLLLRAGLETNRAAPGERPRRSFIRQDSSGGMPEVLQGELEQDVERLCLRAAYARADLERVRRNFSTEVNALVEAVRISPSVDLIGEAEATRRLIRALAAGGRQKMANLYAHGLRRFRHSATPVVRAMGLDATGLVRSSHGAVDDECVRAFLDASELFETAGLVRESAAASLRAGVALSTIGDHLAARSVLDQAIHYSRALAMDSHEAWGRAKMALVLARLGLAEEARAQIETARRYADERSNKHLGATCLLALSQIDLVSGNQRMAAIRATEAREIGHEIARDEIVLASLILEAVALVGEERFHDAVRVAGDAATEIARTGAASELEIDFCLALSRAAEGTHREADEITGPLLRGLDILERKLKTIRSTRLRRAFFDGYSARTALVERAREHGLTIPAELEPE